MSFDINDKKNLPIVVGAVVVLLAVVGFVGFKTLKGPEIPPAPTQTASATPGMDTSATAPGTTPSPTPGATSPAPVTPAATAPTAGAPGMPGGPATGAPGAPGAPGMATPGQPAATDMAKAIVPVPRELYRPDPFAPLNEGKKGPKGPPPVQRLDVPMLGRLFAQPPALPPSDVVAITPEPQRRVAGILLGNRVSALLQTPDGFETVTPGGTLRDGSIVQRIERDRVIIKTADQRPRIIEIKLAGADILGQQGGASSGTPSTGRYMPRPGGIPGMPGMPGGPIRRPSGGRQM